MEDMLELTKGGNTEVPAAALTVLGTWQPRAGSPDVDLSALLLDAEGKVSSDDDFVFFNQPTHPSGTVRHLGASSGTAGRADAVSVDLTRLPAHVDRVVIAAAADGGPFSAVAGLTLRVTGPTGADVLTFPVDAGVETALVAGELYRRGPGWKFRAVGQGYADGLAGLARDFGITVDTPPATPGQTARAAQPDGGSRSEAGPGAGIDWLNPPVPAGYEN
jgi:stress response protein SCP2